MVTGTTGSHQRVRPESLLTMNVIIPPAPIVHRYTELVGPMDERVSLNLAESHTLAATRDALLPKLLSGEIRVKDAEREVGTRL